MPVEGRGQARCVWGVGLLMSADGAGGDTGRIGIRALLTAFCVTVGTWAYGFTWNSVGVALPHMQGSFSATIDQISWIMIAFIIGSAIMTASIGWLSTRFGRREVYLAALAVYTVTLLGCGQSATLTEAVFWRFLQGFSGAPLIPLGQSIAVNAFPPGRHGQATSIWALGFVTGNVIAPTLAGFLIDEFSWPWIFYVNIPVGIAVFTAAWALIPKAPKSQVPLDWIGFTTLIVGVGMLQLVLARGERLDWFDSKEIVLETIVAGLALYLFLAHSLTAKRPFFDLSMFRERNFALGQFFIFLVGVFLYLPLLLLPLLLQQVAGYPAVETGYLLMPRGIGSVLGLLIISQIRDSVDPRPILCIGLLLAAVPTWAMAHWTAEVRAWDVIWTNFVHGCSAGAIWAPLNTLTLARLNKRVQDQGFALFYLNFDIGSAIGTAAIIALHARQSQVSRAVLSEHINPFNELLRSHRLPDIWAIAEGRGLAALENEVTRQAVVIAYNNSFLVTAILIAMLIPLVLMFRHDAKSDKPKDGN